MTLTRRGFLFQACSAVAALSLPRAVRAEAAPALAVHRLHWAGIRIQLGAVALFVDPQLVFARRPEIGVRQPAQIDPVLEARHTLGPEEAVEAAIALRARQLVPIHYGRKPSPSYVETERAEALALEHGKRRGLAVQIVARGEAVRLP